MSRYDRGYDQGMRGWREAVRARAGRPHAGGRYDLNMFDERGDPSRFGNRVTARYNIDYVRPRPNRFRRNYNDFGGDMPGRIGDEGMYRRPYITRGGSWTSRGAMPPAPRGYPSRGPSFGGRYDDELY